MIISCFTVIVGVLELPILYIMFYYSVNLHYLLHFFEPRVLVIILHNILVCILLAVTILKYSAVFLFEEVIYLWYIALPFALKFIYCCYTKVPHGLLLYYGKVHNNSSTLDVKKYHNRGIPMVTH